jgi:hypothetical protein
MTASLSAFIPSTREKSDEPEIFTCLRSWVESFPSALIATLTWTKGRMHNHWSVPLFKITGKCHSAAWV